MPLPEAELDEKQDVVLLKNCDQVDRDGIMWTFFFFVYVTFLC